MRISDWSSDVCSSDLHAARAQAPEAELVYNDFMSWGAGSATHRAGVLRLLAGFRARGVPVDTLGIQSHLVTSGPDIGATVARQEGEWQIGRASCRERVGQNV